MRDDRLTKKYKSATHYILSSIMPYTEANLKLVFLPKRFISDLYKLDRFKSNNIRIAYKRCIKDGLIYFDEHTNRPILSEKALNKLRIFEPRKLLNAKLMVIFDIPESDRWKRQQVRSLLTQLKFTQVQKSVWMSDYDSREYLKQEIKRLNLSNNLQIYESHRLD